MSAKLHRFYQLIRSNKKKTVFFTGVACVCVNYADSRYRENLLLRENCAKLASLGRKPLSKNSSLFRVTVFLNPFAYQRRLLESFDRNVAPLLHISGLDVQMVYLDNDNEAKSFASVLDPLSTDAILVVGDDNLFSKTITGLLRRNDFLTSRLWSIPTYIMPLGIWNCFASIFNNDKNIIQCCYNFVEPILTNSCHRRNVLEITPIFNKPNINEISEKHTANENTTDNTNTRPQSVFSATGLEWSFWRDVEYGGGGHTLTTSQPCNNKQRMQEDWMLFPRQWLKRAGAFFRHSWYWLRSQSFNNQSILNNSEFNSSNENAIRRPAFKQAKLIMTPSCSGCSKCWTAKNKLAVGPPLPPARNYMHLGRLLGLSRSKKDVIDVTVTQSKGLINNPACGIPSTVLLPHAARIALILDGDNICVNISNTAPDIVSHLKQMFHQLISPAYKLTTTNNSLTLPLKAETLLDNSNPEDIKVRCSTVELHPARTNGEFFWIDNDYFEACPVRLSVLHKAINTLPFPNFVESPLAPL